MRRTRLVGATASASSAIMSSSHCQSLDVVLVPTTIHLTRRLLSGTSWTWVRCGYGVLCLWVAFICISS
ncbi:hypothetical protein PIB30_091033, partial [Stylosanthes scabra]|nr:hypothetical protein [Stylosanthes scabra]